MTETAQQDLQHFLKLALAQVKHHIKTNPELSPRLALLEAMIKEQLPNENSNSATRTSR